MTHIKQENSPFRTKNEKITDYFSIIPFISVHLQRIMWCSIAMYAPRNRNVIHNDAAVIKWNNYKIIGI